MKKTVAALTLGLLIGSAGTAVAATNDTVQAVFAKFNFIVNGSEKKLATDPLVVDGTSYLPVREVAGLLGFGLEYDADSRTIKLDNGISTGAGSVGGTTYEIPKGVDNVMTITEEYASLRTIAEKDGLIVSFVQDGFVGIQKGDTRLPIDFKHIKGTIEQPDIIKTTYGEIKMYRSTSQSSDIDVYMNISDWNNVYKNMRDQ
jgi:hypothetical protein